MSISLKPQEPSVTTDYENYSIVALSYDDTRVPIGLEIILGCFAATDNRPLHEQVILDNHRLEPWKMPLPEFIEELYFEQFGNAHPGVILSIEDQIRLDEKKARRREEKRLRRQAKATGQAKHETSQP